jgi:Fur family transcriptional regulator, ferric uptake regulator
MENRIENILKENKVKPTAMRLLVLQYMLKKEVAVSLTTIENFFERSDRTTLFRTLKTFATHEIVHKINDGTGVTKYALCEKDCRCTVEKDLHVHFHCNICDETICFPKNKIPHIELPINYIAEEINLVVSGVCEKCNK